MLNIKSGVAIAATAAALFAMGTAPVAHAADAPVKCAGANSCKGMGWVSKASAQECTSAGGTVSKG